MKRLTLSILCVLLLSATASTQSSGTIVLDFGSPLTHTVTAVQRAKLDRLLAAENASRQTPITLEQWLRAKLIETVQQELLAADRNEIAEACAAFQALTNAQQNTIKTTLGGKSPCR